MSNPYSFVDSDGKRIDWSELADQVCKSVSGHELPISKEELSCICRRKQRENTLYGALRACKMAGETSEAIMLVRQVFNDCHIQAKAERLQTALQSILEIAENCIHDETPLVAKQAFGAPLRKMRRLAAEALGKGVAI